MARWVTNIRQPEKMNATVISLWKSFLWWICVNLHSILYEQYDWTKSVVSSGASQQEDPRLKDGLFGVCMFSQCRMGFLLQSKDMLGD